MKMKFNVTEQVWWITLPGSPHSCAARAYIRAKENIITIFDFWTHGPLQGKGLGKKLLMQIRAKFKRIIIKAIGEPGRAETKKAEGFWGHMYDLGLVDELHYQRRKPSVIREAPPCPKMKRSYSK